MIWINTGRLSSGKTVLSVMLAMETKKRIVTNLDLKVPHTRLRDIEFVRFMKDIMALKTDKERTVAIKRVFHNVVWLVDEGEFLFDARKFGSDIADLGTAFIRQLGKLEADCIITCHILESDIDKRIRGLAQIYGVCFRIDSEGNEMILQPRIVKEKILILCQVVIKTATGSVGGQFTFDPQPYFDLYDTEQMILFNRKAVK